MLILLASASRLPAIRMFHSFVWPSSGRQKMRVQEGKNATEWPLLHNQSTKIH